MLDDLLAVCKTCMLRLPVAYSHLQTEITNFDDVVYGTCTHEDIFHPSFVNEGGSFDWPGPSASLVEVTSQDSNPSASVSSHMPTPDAGIIPDVVTDMGPILTDAPTSASATLEQLLQSMDSDSFLLSGGYGDITQFPLF
jgi:hypothetical protein